MNMAEEHNAATKDAPSRFERTASVSSTEVENNARFKIVSIKQLPRGYVILTAEMSRVDILDAYVLLTPMASASNTVERGSVQLKDVPSGHMLKGFVLVMGEGLSVRILDV